MRVLAWSGDHSRGDVIKLNLVVCFTANRYSSLLSVVSRTFVQADVRLPLRAFLRWAGLGGGASRLAGFWYYAPVCRHATDLLVKATRTASESRERIGAARGIQNRPGHAPAGFTRTVPASAQREAGSMTPLSLARNVREHRFQMRHYRDCAGDPLKN